MLKSSFAFFGFLLVYLAAVPTDPLGAQAGREPEARHLAGPLTQSEFEGLLLEKNRLTIVEFEHTAHLEIPAQDMRLNFQLATIASPAAPALPRGVRVQFQIRNVFDVYVSMAEAYLDPDELSVFARAVSTLIDQLQADNPRERLFRYNTNGGVILTMSLGTGAEVASLMVRDRSLHLRQEELRRLRDVLLQAGQALAKAG